MGQLNLKPAEFWRLAPTELFALLDGYNIRQKIEMEKLAIQACWIVNQAGMRSGRPLRLRDLIKPEIEEKPLTQEELKAMAWQHKQKFWTKIGDKYIKKEE